MTGTDRRSPESGLALTRRWALSLTIFTGFSGLVYEVSWQRYLATLLGSHSEATAAVLGIFLGGLAVGYALFGVVTRRLVARAERDGGNPRLLRWYGLLEVAIGVYALLFPLLFLAIQALSLYIPHGVSGAGFVFDVVLAALLIGPPTILMGGTIPFLTQALARDFEDSTRIHAFVYAFNTFGAFAGALAAGFVLIPKLGLVNVMIAMGLGNLVAGAIFIRLDRRAPSPVRQAAAPAGAAQGLGAYGVVALLTGFAMMTVQAATIRLGALSLGSSELTFAMVVAAFVLCIALGSFAVSALRRIPGWLLLANQWALVFALAWLYTRLEDAPYLAHRIRILFTTQEAALVPYQVAVFLGILGLLAVPVLLSGASLPLLFNHLRQRFGDLGAVAGRLYSWNTVGSLLGALLGGYALLFWYDLHVIFRVAVFAVAAGALILGFAHPGGLSKVVTAAAMVPVGALLLTLNPWSPQHVSPGLFRAWSALPYSNEPPDEMLEKWWAGVRFPFFEDDPSVTVLVTENDEDSGGISRSVLVNGKSDSATHGDAPTTGLLGILPALFAQKMERGFVIGYGTGFTVGELAALDSAQEVVVAEISEGVIRAAPLFDFANRDSSTNPIVRFVRSDAYRALLREDGQFDVIVSEPSNPWVTGVEMLYSREFLRAARDKLAPGGVYVQWFHQYSTNDEAVELVLRTYADVFDHVAVWYGLGRDLLLLGFDDAASALDLERLESRAARADFADGLRRSELGSFPALLAHELLPLGVVHALALEGPKQTLLHPRLNHIAARAYFQGGAGQLPFSGSQAARIAGAEHSLLRRYLEGEGRRPPANARLLATLEACRHRTNQCTMLMARWAALAGGTDRALQQAANQARQVSARAFGGRFNPNNVAPLVSSYFSDAPPSAVSPAVARRATRTLRIYYSHGVPMDAERLLAIWDRCEDPDAESTACRDGREEARELLGMPAEPPSVVVE